ncbi:MAG: N-acetylmuramoyl-L-alanine amidase [Archangium sp.]|nr:N-acetylmuramoyl-L-alanine amidase [Archangium sp.]
MNRILLTSMVALLWTACGNADASLVVKGGDDSERFVGGDEEVSARTAPLYDADFQAAGEEFDVPPALLKALSWSLTRYEMVTGEGEFEGGRVSIGLMGLSAEAVTEGALLAHVSEDQVRTEAKANIRAAAAVLSARATVAGVERAKLLSWSTVIGDYAGLDDLEARAAFLRGEVYTALELGVGAPGDALSEDARAEVQGALGEYADVQQGLTRAPDFGSGVWRPSPNFNSRGGERPKFVVIHTCEGAYSGCWGWLTNTRAGASAHYVVNSTGSEISQLVRESDRAWHIAAEYQCSRNGNQMCGLNGASSNTHSVGIEHAGFASQSSWPAGQIDASARLVCNITKDWGIARDRFHIVGHGQLQPWNRTDPGANWPWTSYLQKINAACGTTPNPNPNPNPTPTEVIIDSNNANNNQAKGYIQVSANWKSSTNVAGYYGSGYWHAPTASVSDGAAFFFKVDTAGARTIDAWWTAASDRSTGATFVAFNAQGDRIGEGTVNQTINGGKWNQVGRFNFTVGWNKIVLSRWQAPGKVVIADAVRIR